MTKTRRFWPAALTVSAVAVAANTAAIAQQKSLPDAGFITPEEYAEKLRQL